MIPTPGCGKDMFSERIDAIRKERGLSPSEIKVFESGYDYGFKNGRALCREEIRKALKNVEENNKRVTNQEHREVMLIMLEAIRSELLGGGKK